MIEEMDGKRSSDAQTSDVELGRVYDPTKQDWPADLREPFPNTFYRVSLLIDELK